MIIAKNISKNYNDVQALKGISFEVNEDEIFGFIGPDGAGKTTLFRILTSLLLPDSGSAELFGNDVVKEYRTIRNITGYMPGRFSLYPDLSIEENLEFFATVFGTNINENYDLIRDVYHMIEPFKKRLAGRLSGGMKQKLALSCALIHRPKVLVLDEPTTGVDAVSRREFWELLKGLKAKGITIIVSTPYMDEADLCDRIALIQDGKILTIDEPKQSLQAFEGKLYSLKSENIYHLLKDIREYPSTDNAFPFGQVVHYTDINDETNLESIVDYLKQRGHRQIEIKEIQPDIEDLFMQLMLKAENNNEK